jgi:hypothetical protein
MPKSIGELKAEAALKKTWKIACVITMAKELCLQLEADKHRDQPELLEVQLLTAIEEMQREGG